MFPNIFFKGYIAIITSVFSVRRQWSTFSPTKKCGNSVYSCACLCVSICTFLCVCVHIYRLQVTFRCFAHNSLLHLCSFVWFQLLQSGVAWKLQSFFIFDFSFVEQGMAGAILTFQRRKQMVWQILHTHRQASRLWIQARAWVSVFAGLPFL